MDLVSLRCSLLPDLERTYVGRRKLRSAILSEQPKEEAAIVNCLQSLHHTPHCWVCSEEVEGEEEVWMEVARLGSLARRWDLPHLGHPGCHLRLVSLFIGGGSARCTRCVIMAMTIELAVEEPDSSFSFPLSTSVSI
ncbi:hypothetical protein INR49_011401 [Caranx melampygus]|nr:hypothetical protein INR49_011401 [Caranx melampygus]